MDWHLEWIDLWNIWILEMDNRIIYNKIIFLNNIRFRCNIKCHKKTGWCTKTIVWVFEDN